MISAVVCAFVIGSLVSPIASARPVSELAAAAPSVQSALGGGDVQVTPFHGARPPNYIAGYTPHALDRMRKRGVSKSMVEDAVSNPKRYGWDKRHNTWQITDQKSRIIVSLNDNAWVVTILVIKRA
ncbi:DUF4258 domain-containing protein [Corynebacterium timonense]